MPRMSKAKLERQKKKRIAMALGGLVLVAVLTALMLAVPGFSPWLFRVLGISQGAVRPTTGVDSPTAVHVIDVGQGDAVLLEESGEFALVDAGPPEGEAALLAYLQAAGVQRLRYVFVTHPHADHYGGMQAVVEAYPVETAVLPDFSLAPYPTASSFLSLIEAMNAAGMAAETAAEGAEYPLGSGVVTVIHAGLQTEDNYNLLSLGLRFDAGDFSFLNTGDGEKANERAMLEGAGPLRAQVLLAGHHGSSTSNTSAFMQAVRPRLVVVSCAAGNSYGHPHKSALKAFNEAGAVMLRCDKNGTVVAQPGEDGGVVYAVAKPTEDAAA